ncbi:MAG: glycosyltransferase family A protein [Balneolales bacterium]
MLRKKDFISVVIPCYNHGAYIQEAVNSVLDQTYNNFEIIIVDDGSNDRNTIKVLDELDDPKVTVLRKKNGYVSSARNHGIRYSLGEYILTLDADDMFAPTFLEKALPVLKEQPEIGVVTSYLRNFNNKGFQKIERTKGGGVENFLTENQCNASALFRYQCWADAGGYNESYNAITKGYEDKDFWLSVARKGWKIYSIPESLFWYRTVPGSMSTNNISNRPEMVRRLVKRHKKAYREHVVDVIYKMELKIQKVNEIKKSRTYKVGRILLSPLILIRDFSFSINKTKERFAKRKRVGMKY